MHRPSAIILAVLTFTFAASAHADGAPAPPPPTEQASARTDIEGTVAAMRGTALRVRDLLRDARKRGTKQQVACLDEALSRSDAALRHARESGDASLAAYARGDLEEARTMRLRVSEWREAQRLAARDGVACSPSLKLVDARTTATTVRVSVDPRMPKVE